MATPASLSGKKILLGITAGIAAYKSIELIRLLKKAGALVRVVQTPASESFVTPLTLQAISGEAVANSLLDPQAELAMGHIELAKWADLILIAPASADFIARLTHGLANDLLSTLCLASAAPIAIAPAMNQQMFRQAITQANLAQLRARGVLQIGPEAGEQACGDVGFGRMGEPQTLFDFIAQHFSNTQKLAGLRVTITAGPTREAIDPVRYISNHSSGKMGFALAEAFAKQGASVTLISGPVQISCSETIARVDVVSAQEMLEAAERAAPNSDIFIGCAAVADYRMAEVATQKMKKQAGQEGLTLMLVKNPDIIAQIAAMAENRPFVVGFAAETENVACYARDKLTRKNLDLICANDVSGAESGMNSDFNAVQLIWQAGEQTLPRMHKTELAEQLAQAILARFEAKDHTA